MERESGVLIQVAEAHLVQHINKLWRDDIDSGPREQRQDAYSGPSAGRLSSGRSVGRRNASMTPPQTRSKPGSVHLSRSCPVRVGAGRNLLTARAGSVSQSHNEKTEDNDILVCHRKVARSSSICGRDTPVMGQFRHLTMQKSAHQFVKQLSVDHGDYGDGDSVYASASI